MADLETTLLELCKVGKPRVSRMDHGWYCHIDMYVSAAGATFEVASEIKHATPSAAADECAQRVDAILHGFATGASAKAITHG